MLGRHISIWFFKLSLPLPRFVKGQLVPSFQLEVLTVFWFVWDFCYQIIKFVYLKSNLIKQRFTLIFLDKKTNVVDEQRGF